MENPGPSRSRLYRQVGESRRDSFGRFNVLHVAIGPDLVRSMRRRPCPIAAFPWRRGRSGVALRIGRAPSNLASLRHRALSPPRMDRKSLPLARGGPARTELVRCCGRRGEASYAGIALSSRRCAPSGQPICGAIRFGDRSDDRSVLQATLRSLMLSPPNTATRSSIRRSAHADSNPGFATSWSRPGMYVPPRRSPP